MRRKESTVDEKKTTFYRERVKKRVWNNFFAFLTFFIYFLLTFDLLNVKQ